LVARAQETLYIQNFASGGSVGTIPDGNPIGVTFSGTVTDVPAGLTVGGLTVGLNLSGGYNGNLYAYLVSPGGTQVLLMNEPGVSAGNPFGAGGPGMNLTLQDAGAANGSIQNATSASVLTGSYNAAGLLAGFNGAAPDGTWELFFADEVSGGGTSTLNSWTLNLTAMPEPQLATLEILGGIFWGSLWLARRHLPPRPSDGRPRSAPVPGRRKMDPSVRAPAQKNGLCAFSCATVVSGP
jgi:subtilisin-like proprotein convertase family protein